MGIWSWMEEVKQASLLESDHEGYAAVGEAGLHHEVSLTVVSAKFYVQSVARNKTLVRRLVEGVTGGRLPNS